MKRKGFTLIELLAVIVILAVIAVIAVPTITNIISKASKSAFEDSVYGIVKAGEYYYNNQLLKEDGMSETKTFTFPDNVEGLEIKGSKPTRGTIKVSKNGKVLIAVTNEKYCARKSYGEEKIVIDENIEECTKTISYKDEAINGADPELGQGMIPITISNDGTATVADIYNEENPWYDYDKKKWANAVKLVSGTYTVGQVIPESAIQAYFVWIPRYKYKIFNEGNYTSSISGTPTSSTKQTIDIVFESKDKTASTGSTVGSYLTHPSFTSLDTNGLWVGKYETGYNGATSTATAQVSSTDSTKIIVKPNVYSWRSNTVYNMFIAAYNYDLTNNSHMMKNTEWGAVAYLSHSVYGINKEININNNSSFKTGYSALTTTNQTTYPGTFGDGATYNQPYNTETGYLASTTGNISGIYDMSGGAWEYMAAYMSGQLGGSGFTTTTIANTDYAKYLDVYSASSTIASYNNRILGDATGEIGPFYSYADGDGSTRYHNSWYADPSYFVDSSSPWFSRGGGYYYGVLAGQFYFTRVTGAVYSAFGSRLVLAD